MARSNQVNFKLATAMILMIWMCPAGARTQADPNPSIPCRTRTGPLRLGEAS